MDVSRKCVLAASGFGIATILYNFMRLQQKLFRFFVVSLRAGLRQHVGSRDDFAVFVTLVHELLN